MKKIRMKTRADIRITGICGFFEKIVTKFGTGAKIDCPKEYLGKKVFVVVKD